MASDPLTRRGFLVGLATTATALALPAVAYAGAGRGLGGGVISADDLVFLREEEKLARDVYLTLYDRWGFQVFGNIADSEQRHTSSVLGLLDAYDIPDPVVDDQVGVFTNAEIAHLYDELVALGQTSEIDALVVGATIEDLDIYDITEMLRNTDARNVTRVLESLRCGSHSHARAFDRVLQTYGITYQPQYTAQAEWDAVLAGTSLSC